jgi:hypothetical protein
MLKMMKNKRTEGKIKTHYGMRDYFKFFKEENPTIKLTAGQFSDIIQRFNLGVVNLIIEDNLNYKLPYLGASLAVKKDKRVPRIIDGKLYNPTPVDWQATNKLWDEDSEAKEKKLLVRYNNNHTSKYVFRINFKKYIYPFANKKYYNFQTCRTFARTLGERINDEDKDRYDTFLLY